MDFYPNGGGQQPGCAVPPCSHSRSWELFSASIDTEDRFPSVKCISWDIFVSGSCDKNEQVFMGYGMDKTKRGIYYLKTDRKAPFGFGGLKPEIKAKSGLFKYL